MLHPLTARFRDPRTERGYRAAHIDADRAQAQITCAVLLVPMIIFFVSDLGFFAAQTLPLGLMLVRAGMIVATLALLLRMRRPIAARSFDLAVALWWVTLACFVLYINSTRPPGYLLHNAVDTAICILSFVVPSIPIPLQLLAPLVLAGGNLIEASQARGFAGSTPLLVLTLTYATVIVLGCSTSWRLHALRRRQYATEQEQAELREQLETLANTDVLTGVPNRRNFLVRAAAEFARAQRHARALSVLMLDIDRFKSINDRWGHQTGDAALVAVAAALGRALRTEDVLARMGGEEFALLLPETSSAQAVQAAERLRALCAALPFHPDDPSQRLTVSIGVAGIGTGDTEIDDALRRADKALYEAKHSGRDRVIAR